MPHRALDRQFVEKFEHSIYADDLTFGANNGKDAFPLCKKAKEWLAEGAFNLRKIHTNFRELQCQTDAQENKTDDSFADGQFTAVEDLSYAKDMLGNYHGNVNGMRVLGVQWITVWTKWYLTFHHICNAADVADPLSGMLLTSCPGSTILKEF